MTKRRREVDEFPQQLQDAFSCALVDGSANGVVSGNITQTEWRMPIELDLNHPIFMECSKIHCTQDIPLGGNIAIAATGIVGAPSFTLYREIKIMKEARGTTTWPLDSDRATLATFRMKSGWSATTATATAMTYVEDDKWAYFEDARTGYGELIAQPRLFVLTRSTIAAAITQDPAQVANKNLFLSMHYRLTTRIHGKEYLTELIAKFT